MTAPDPALVEHVAMRAAHNLRPQHMTHLDVEQNWRWGAEEWRDWMRRLATAVMAEHVAALRESGRLVEWRPIGGDTPLGMTLLLAMPDGGRWAVETGPAGMPNTCAAPYSNGWRNGFATHWAPLPAPPATAATEGE